MKLVKVEELNKEAEYLRLCGYGEPGTGKTWFGASACLAEETSPVMYLEYRAQIASIRSNPEYIDAIEDGRLVILTLDDYEDLNYVYSWLSVGPGNVEPLDKLFDGKHPKTVVFDSLTELQRAEVMRRAGNKPGKFIRDVEQPQIQHWGSLLNQFTLLAHLYFQLNMHVVFLGLESVDYASRVVGEAQRVTGHRLALQGQAQRQFPAYALTVMRFDKAPRGSNAYNVGLTQSSLSKTKEQTGMFPAKIGNPTIPKMVKYLQGGDIA